MVDFSSFGTVVTFTILAVYFLFTIIRETRGTSNSLRNVERLHRFLLIAGGVFIGFGLGSLQLGFGEIKLLGDDFILSMMIFVAGIFLAGFGIVYLSNSLWDPLENISEYSAEFGTHFIATRLPEAGGVELQRFASRFNENAILLSNAISELEINVEIIEENISSTVASGKSLTEVTSGLSDIALQYSKVSQDQHTVVSRISKEVGEFANWYTQTQEQLSQNFIELRSISEMGNLIAINAAVEASNLETPHPGIETIASRLRDLARSLEERQESLRRLMDDVNLNYEDFRSAIQNDLTKALGMTKNTNNLGDRVDQILREIGSQEMVFRDNAGELERSITSFRNSIPTAYI